MKTVPREYPRPYLQTPNDVDFCRVILWLITPKGKQSKFFQSFMIKDLGYKKDLKSSDFPNYAKEQCIECAKDTYKTELKKGYTIGEVFLISSRINGEITLY